MRRLSITFSARLFPSTALSRGSLYPCSDAGIRADLVSRAFLVQMAVQDSSLCPASPYPRRALRAFCSPPPQRQQMLRRVGGGGGGRRVGDGSMSSRTASHFASNERMVCIALSHHLVCVCVCFRE